MKLYSKKLNSIEDLKREQRILKSKRSDTNLESILSLDDLFKKNAPDHPNDKKESNNLIADIISSDLPFKEMLLDTGNLLLKKAGVELQDKGKEVGKRILKTAAREVIGGYLKWMAIQLSYKGIVKLIKSRKEKDK